MIIGNFNKKDLKVYVDYYFKQYDIDSCRTIGYFDAITHEKTLLLEQFEEVFNSVTLGSLNIDNLDYYTLPEHNSYYLEVLPEFLGVFKDNKFIFGEYEIPLYEINNKKCVNTAHFGWQQFRNDLDELMPDGTFRHQALKDVLMPLWDNLALQVENNNFIIVE